MVERRIVALGGGGFMMEPDNPRLDRFILSLARRTPPKVCYVPTASGDSESNIAKFYDAHTVERCLPSHLRLFKRTIRDLRSFILDQDVIFVGGGATGYMLSMWRMAGLDAIFREAWETGVVLSGVSAGALCWFEAGLTDTLGRPLQILTDGLGFLSGSFCPHYDGERDRRPVYQAAVGAGTLPPGTAADDGVGVVYHGTEIAEFVSSRTAARAWRVERAPEGVRETEIVPRYLE
ncbi:MAG TPA: peptidase E [bacterium]|nr:peptidase E [bacterium]